MEICGMNTCLDYNNEQESNCDRWLDGILNTCPHYNEAPQKPQVSPSSSSDLLCCKSFGEALEGKAITISGEEVESKKPLYQIHMELRPQYLCVQRQISFCPFCGVPK